jgi:hypothetical protein
MMNKGKFSRTDVHTVWMHDGLFEFIQHADEPFFYTASDGAVIMPPPRLVTDFGSIPKAVRWFLNPVEFAPAYINHDDTYQFARVNCTYRPVLRMRMRSIRGGEDDAYSSHEWEPVGGIYINRWQSDYYLSEMIFTLTNDANWKRFWINSGLAAGAWVPWNKHGDDRQKSAAWYWGDKR